MVTGKITIDPGINLTAETSTKIIIEKEETTTIEVVIAITDPIIGIIVGPMIKTTTEMVVGTIIDQIIEGMTVTIGMVTEIRIMVDPETGIEIGEIGVAHEKVPNLEVVVDPKIKMRVGDRVEVMPEIETGLNQDPDNLLMSVQKGIEVGAINAMSMIILQENALMMLQVKIQMTWEALF